MSSQALSIVAHEVEDLYYTDPANCKVQAIPVEMNTRFRQDFSNKGTGSSTFLIPPGNGLRCPVIVLGYNASTLAGQTGKVALPRGWGYLALSQLSFRIGGSTQFFMSGQQLLNKNLRMCRTKEQRNSILSLGGNEVKATADFAVNQYAYIPLSFWCGPSSDGLTLPLPADLLSQQVQITAQLAPTSAFWVTNPQAVAGTQTPPSQLDTAYYQIEQLQMPDKAMSLANRVDLDTHSYAMPVSFDQQEVIISNVVQSSAPQSLVLSGFRAGMVDSIQVWCRKTSDALNPGVWYKPASVEMLYAGTIFASYLDGTSAVWNLIDSTAPNAVEQSVLADAGSVAPLASTGRNNEWVTLPFGQRTGDDYSADVRTHGKEITNGIVNLTLALPADAGVGGVTYDVHVVYSYSASIAFSRGSSEFVF
jgi:hypothetical protein